MLGCLAVPRFPLACELAERPELDDLPVAVVTAEGEVWAASEAAERMAVQTGQRQREALARCPDLIVLEGRPSHYRSCSECIVEALGQVAFTVEPGGDGMALVDFGELLPLHPSQDAVSAALLACVPKILNPVLGVAASRLAAQAAAMSAPRGSWRLVSPSQLSSFLAALPVEVLPVSFEVRRRLRLLGLTRLGQLAVLPRSKLVAQFGLEGGRAWEMANGVDTTPLRRWRSPERVRERLRLDLPLVTLQGVMVAFEQLLAKLRRNPVLREVAARQAVLRMEGERGASWERTVTFKEATAQSERLLGALHPVLVAAVLPGPIVQVELELSGLVPIQGEQLALSIVRPNRRDRLEEGLRQLKVRYGYCPVSRVLEVEPWSRLPERRLALVDLDP